MAVFSLDIVYLSARPNSYNTCCTTFVVSLSTVDLIVELPKEASCEHC
jgi:hypothetical protein